MFKGCAVLAFVACFLLSSHAQTVTSGPQHLTPKQYLDELDRWRQKLKEQPSTEATHAPEDWVVDCGRQQCRVSTSFLNIFTDEERETALDHLQELRESAQTVGVHVGKSPEKTAQEILSRREYRGVHTPGQKESWSDRLVQFALKVLRRVFGAAIENTAAIRNFVTILTWAVLLGAASFLFYWIFQTLQALSAPKMHLEAPSTSEYVSSKPAERWLEEARIAGENGQFRLAVCLAYWGGIAGLERAGAWRPDRARTPREYLRQAANNSALAALRSLTRDFERVWYAKQSATKEDLDSALLKVKELGWQ